eukprot:UN29240
MVSKKVQYTQDIARYLKTTRFIKSTPNDIYNMFQIKMLEIKNCLMKKVMSDDRSVHEAIIFKNRHNQDATKIDTVTGLRSEDISNWLYNHVPLEELVKLYVQKETIVDQWKNPLPPFQEFNEKEYNVCFTGPSGAGKSSLIISLIKLLKMLYGNKYKYPKTNCIKVDVNECTIKATKYTIINSQTEKSVL